MPGIRGVLANRDREDAADHQDGGDDTPRAETLAEAHGPDAGPDDDAGLPERGDGADRATGLRPKDKAVGEEAHAAARAAACPGRAELGEQCAPAPDEGVEWDRRALTEDEPTDVARRGARQADTKPVDRGVGGDGQTRGDSRRDGGPLGVAAAGQGQG